MHLCARTLLVFLIPCVQVPLGAEDDVETGTVRGVVRNADAADLPVEGARVQVLDTALEATTGADGTFEILDVPAGRRRLEVTRAGLAPARAVAVVPAGGTAEVPVALFREEEAVQTYVIVGTLIPGVARTLDVKREFVSQQALRTSAEFKLSAAGDAGQIVQELPGVHTVDSKFAYVRGLGERYSQTLLNNSNIPSPEPDKRVIPLDLFPASVVGSIAVVKTYSPDLPGEFSGGSVQIATVEVPREDFVNLSVDFKYRHGTTFRDFSTYHGGNLDKFSFDDGTRAIPREVPSSDLGGLPPEQVQEVGRSFPNIWEPATVTAPLDHKLGLSFGKRIGEAGESSLGIVGAVNWANKYQTIKDEKRRIVANEGTPQGPRPFIFSDFTFDSATFEAELSALLNVTYDINYGQTIGIRNLYTRSSEDEVRRQTGSDGQRPSDEPIDLTRLRWVERSLFSTQPFGEHLLVGDTLLEWRASYSLSQRDEPDNRQVRYLFDTARQDFVFEDVSGSGRRDFYILDENIYDAAVDYSIPFNPFGVPDKGQDVDRKTPEQRIKLGPSVVFRDRDFNGRRFRLRPLEPGQAFDENGRPIDLAGSPEDLFQDPNINPRGFRLIEETRATDDYEAQQLILAGYGLFDFRISEDLRLQAGARVEHSSQTIETFEQGTFPPRKIETELETTDPLPAAQLVWEFARVPLPRREQERTPQEPAREREKTAEEKAREEAQDREGLMQLRLAASQTVSRPEFRELAPFQYTDVQGGYTAQGNPDLERAKVWNADLGWEWYWGPSELLAAGIFYKHLVDPIEVINRPTSSGLLTTWENADQADLFGFEIEARKGLGFIGDRFQDLSMIVNFSWIKSEVTIKDDPTSQQTNDKRPLQGQSDYLFNVGLIYDSKELGFSAAVLANSFGERISAVGASGIDDEIELPRWDLSFSITKNLGKWSLKLSGENLLNYSYEYEQSGITTREYRRGLAIGIGASYSF